MVSAPQLPKPTGISFIYLIFNRQKAAMRQVDDDVLMNLRMKRVGMVASFAKPHLEAIHTQPSAGISLK
jgi:hypothetical protein